MNTDYLKILKKNSLQYLKGGGFDYIPLLSKKE